jgi:hypothetical protein
MAIANPGSANAADDPPPPDPPVDGVASTCGAKKLGPPDDVELRVPVNTPEVLLVNPPVLPPDGINPRTASGFTAVVVAAAGPPAEVSNDVNTVAGDTGPIAVSALPLLAGAGLSWAATLMPLVASTPAANAAVIMVFFLPVGLERCLDIFPLRTLVGPDRCGDHAVPHRQSGALNRTATNWYRYDGNVSRLISSGWGSPLPQFRRMGRPTVECFPPKWRRITWCTTTLEDRLSAPSHHARPHAARAAWFGDDSSSPLLNTRAPADTEDIAARTAPVFRCWDR